MTAESEHTGQDHWWKETKDDGGLPFGILSPTHDLFRLLLRKQRDQRPFEWSRLAASGSRLAARFAQCGSTPGMIESLLSLPPLRQTLGRLSLDF